MQFDFFLVPTLQRGNEKMRDVISTELSLVAVRHMNVVVQLGGLLSERLGQTRVSNRPYISVHWFALPRTWFFWLLIWSSKKVVATRRRAGYEKICILTLEPGNEKEVEWYLLITIKKSPRIHGYCRLLTNLRLFWFQLSCMGTRISGYHIHEAEFRRCNANERCRSIGRFAVWAFGTNASFKPPWYQHSLICITAILIFLVTTASLNFYCVKVSLHWNFVLLTVWFKTQSLCMQSDCGAG